MKTVGCEARVRDLKLQAYPHLQKFMPPVPSRFVQTRESTQAAISDTYNGDGKVYSALRAAAYVSWGIVTSLGAPSETGLRA